MKDIRVKATMITLARVGRGHLKEFFKKKKMMNNSIVQLFLEVCLDFTYLGDTVG